MKKLLSLALCFLMVFSAIVPAFAEDVATEDTTTASTPTMTRTGAPAAFTLGNTVTYYFTDYMDQQTTMRDYRGTKPDNNVSGYGNNVSACENGYITLWGPEGADATYDVTFTVPETGYYSFSLQLVTGNGTTEHCQIPVTVDGGTTYYAYVRDVAYSFGLLTYYGMDNIFLYAGEEHTFSLGRSEALVGDSKTQYYSAFQIAPSVQHTTLDRTLHTVPEGFTADDFVPAYQNLHSDDPSVTFSVYEAGYDEGDAMYHAAAVGAASGWLKMDFTVPTDGWYTFAFQMGGADASRGLDVIYVDEDITSRYSAHNGEGMGWMVKGYFTGMTKYLTAGAHTMNFLGATDAAYFMGFYVAPAENVPGTVIPEVDPPIDTDNATAMTELSSLIWRYVQSKRADASIAEVKTLAFSAYDWTEPC